MTAHFASTGTTLELHVVRDSLFCKQQGPPSNYCYSLYNSTVGSSRDHPWAAMEVYDSTFCSNREHHWTTMVVCISLLSINRDHTHTWPAKGGLLYNISNVTNLISVDKIPAQLPNFPVNIFINTCKKRCTLRIDGLRPQDYIIILWAVHVHSPLPASSGFSAGHQKC